MAQAFSGERKEKGVSISSSRRAGNLHIPLQRAVCSPSPSQMEEGEERRPRSSGTPQPVVC
jgi:hypothetical protein